MISIIVPIYNSERYLEECIESVLSQTYDNYELILVDDGSTDNSRKIYKKYLNNQKIKIIEQENAGVSAARNNGINVSNGNIIIFLDSDDYLEKNALEIISKEMKDNDLLCYAYTLVYKNCSECITVGEELHQLKEIEDRIFMNKKIGGYICNKPIKSEINKNNFLKLNKVIHYCEDLVFVSQYLNYCSKGKYINVSLYNYRMRGSSISFSKANAKKSTVLSAYDILLKKYKNNESINKYLLFNYLMSYQIVKNNISEKVILNKEIISNEKKILLKQPIKNIAKYVLFKYFRKLYEIIKMNINRKKETYE